MKKDAFIIVGIIVIGLLLYGLTLRGAPGNPTADQVKNNLEQPTQAFELSPERGRYAQVASLANTGVYNLSSEWAAVAYPDVGISSDGKIDSYFAPGVSYLALPFYLFGARYGLAQVATFSVESLASIITLVFIYIIGRRIFTLPRWGAFFSVLVYGFASTSWSYAITLYEHSFSAMFAVTMFYAVWRFSQKENRHAWLYAAYVWLAYALTITINYPDALLMLPIMVYLAISTFSFKKLEEGIALSIRWGAIATFVVFVFVTGLHFWHNTTYYGGWSHVAGTLTGYTPEGATSTQAVAVASSTAATTTAAVVGKNAVGFFHESLIPNSLFILLFSDQRGLFLFSPIFILSFFGIAYAFRKKELGTAKYVVPLSLIALNLFLYSAWADPWGGWAYGPRYLIQSMPWLALFIGVFLSAVPRGRKSFWTRGAVFLLFAFSTAIALVGALTTNAVPPKSDALTLPIKTYNVLHDVPYIFNNRSGSFIYNTYSSHTISLTGYFVLIYSFVILLALIALCIKEKQYD